ncbi:MAG TPA: type VI secretion system contractile sheath large subunit [Polyangiaceae bacterium]|jgi:type VI secretion system protein ImpC
MEELKNAKAAEAPLAELPSLLEEIVAETKIEKTDEGYDVARRAVPKLLAELLKPQYAAERVDNHLIDAMIAEIDRKVSLVVDNVMHAPEFQKREAAWRGVKFLVDRTDFRENVRLEILNVSKQDLLADFEDSPEVVKSGLYKTVYTAEYGQFGGKPYGAVIANYEIGPGPQDMLLLQKAAAVAAMSHAPFFAAAGPQFFGLKDIQELPNMKDLDSLFEGPQFTKWRGLRESEDARYLGLVMPRFLLRLPYGPATVPAKTFNYEESVSASHEHYLWGNAVFAFATRLTESFAKYRWCPNIIGPQAGGTVPDLPVHVYQAMGADQIKIPTEVLISERREYELSEQGFIALTYRKDSDNAAFFSANSVQKPKRFPGTEEGKAAEVNYKLGTQLPYLFVANRLAHYLKVIQREQIGTSKERGDLERELNEWIRQYVADMEAPTAAVRGKRPLRQASIKVTEVPGDAGWYRSELQIRPHFKYMGAFFTLSLVGKMDKE